jgi:hypothetical protein
MIVVDSVMREICQQHSRVFCVQNISDSASSSNGDVDRYVIIRKSLDPIFNTRIISEGVLDVVPVSYSIFLSLSQCLFSILYFLRFFASHSFTFWSFLPKFLVPSQFSRMPTYGNLYYQIKQNRTSLNINKGVGCICFPGRLTLRSVQGRTG